MKQKNYKILLFLLASILFNSCKIQKIEKDVLINLLEVNNERNLKDNERPKPCLCDLADKKIVLIKNNNSSFAEFEKDSSILNKLKYFNSFSKDMYSDFIKKNKGTYNIRLNNVANKEVLIISKTKLDNFLRNENWEVYNKTVGSAPIVHLSRPGFNQNKSKALVYLSISRGELSGTGYYFILEKQQKEWNIIECYLAWIS